MANATIKIGDKTVKRIGLGTNRIHENEQSFSLLQRAVELGVNFIDTAHVYADGESEKAIGSVLAPYPDDLVIATKGGMGGASPEKLEAELHESLKRLDTESIYLYQLHRVDPDVPLTETITALKKFQEQGLITHIGLSEVSVAQLKEAQEISPIVSVQNEYNVAVRHHEELVDYCDEQGIVFIPWFPLGGLRGDTVKVEAKLKELTTKYDANVQQLALAWLLQRSPMILPIPGTLSIAHLEENLAATTVELSDEDYKALTEI